MKRKTTLFLLFALLIAALTGLSPSITLAEDDMPWGQPGQQQQDDDDDGDDSAEVRMHTMPSTGWH